jgi:hypothetical protein
VIDVSINPQTEEANSQLTSEEDVAEEPCKGCADCGTTERALMTESPSRSPEEARGKPLYCMECNPRFRYLDAVFTGLERLES